MNYRTTAIPAVLALVVSVLAIAWWLDGSNCGPGVGSPAEDAGVSATLVHPSVPASVPSGSPSVAQAATGVVGTVRHLAVDPRIETITDRSKKLHDRLETLIALNSAGECIAFREDLDLVVDVLRDRTEDDTLRHEAANLLIRHNHTDLVAPLLAIVFDDEDNPRFRSFAVQHLWRLSADGRTDGVEGITAGLRLASRNGPLPVRREAFLGLVRNGDREASETAVKLLTGEAGEGMRDLAVRCVREMGLTNQVDAIRRLVGSANESEQIAALVTVGQWRDKDSRSVVEAACKSKSERVRRAAATALAAIDGAM